MKCGRVFDFFLWACLRVHINSLEKLREKRSIGQSKYGSKPRREWRDFIIVQFYKLTDQDYEHRRVMHIVNALESNGSSLNQEGH